MSAQDIEAARAHWNQRYTGCPTVLSGDPVKEIAAITTFLPPLASVLSLTDGQGRNSLPLAQMGHQVTAVELIPAASRHVEQIAQAEGLDVCCICADVAQ